MEPWIIFAIIAAVVGTVIVLGRWWEKQYTAAWQRAAAELELPYYDAANDLLVRFGRLAVLNRGRRQQVRHAIVANDGEVEIAIADFRFVTGSGKHTQHHKETLCLVASAGLSLPYCALRPQSRLFDYLGKLFGGQDIDFDDDPEFSAAYVLQGHHPEAVRALFDAPIRAWFTAHRAGGLHFEAQADLLAFHFGKKLKPELARALIAQALEIRQLFCSRDPVAVADVTGMGAQTK
jgi:hypothetical protein